MHLATLYIKHNKQQWWNCIQNNRSKLRVAWQLPEGRHYLKHNRGGGVRMNCEQADALQRPPECHLILPLLPSCKNNSPFQWPRGYSRDKWHCKHELNTLLIATNAHAAAGRSELERKSGVPYRSGRSWASTRPRWRPSRGSPPSWSPAWARTQRPARWCRPAPTARSRGRGGAGSRCRRTAGAGSGSALPRGYLPPLSPPTPLRSSTAAVAAAQGESRER